MNSIGERILEIQRYYFGDKRGSKANFAKAIGENSNTVSNWFGRKDGIGDAVINKILSAFPEVDKGWLVGGNGEMLTATTINNSSTISPQRESNSTDINSIGNIKILDIRVCAGQGIGFDGNENKVIGSVNIPEFAGCYGIIVYGDSMYDKYMSGDIIFVRKIVDKSLIENGQPYVIITNEDRLLKLVYIEDDCLSLVSYNTVCNPDGRRKYPDMKIDGRHILHLYKVVGKLARTQM